MQKVYQSNYKTIIPWFFALGLFMLVIGLWGNFSIQRMIEGIILVSIWIIPLNLFIYFTRVIINEKNLQFPGRTFFVVDILEINKGASFKVAKGAYQSLYIIYKKQNQRKNFVFKILDGLQHYRFYRQYPELDYIDLRFAAFKEQTLAELIYDLKNN